MARDLVYSKEQQVKSLTQFVTAVLASCGELCGGIDTTRDIKTIMSRVDSEGDQFLTITLPSFAKGLEQAIAREKVFPSDFAGFSRNGELPKFLGGFLDLIFDRRSGSLHEYTGFDDDGDWAARPGHYDDMVLQAQAIQAIRQVCMLTAKIAREASEGRQAAALESYVRIEEELRESDRTWLEYTAYADQFRTALYGRLFYLVYSR